MPPHPPLMDHGSYPIQNTPHPKTGTSHGRFGDFSKHTQDIPPPKTGTSHGGLCVMNWCIETTAVSAVDTVSLIHIFILGHNVNHFIIPTQAILGCSNFLASTSLKMTN